MAKKKKKEEVILTPEQQLEADYQKAVRRMEGAEKMLQPEDKVHMYKEAVRMFEALGDYEDSEARRKRCQKRLPLARREHREDVYQTGMRLKAEAKTAADYEAAIAEFQRLRNVYKDIPDQIAECFQLKEKALRNERNRGIVKKLLAGAVFAAAVCLIVFLRSPAAYYMEGRLLMGIHDYERANTIFSKSAGYKDTARQVRECNYQRALASASEGDYKKAVRLLKDRVGDYKDGLEKKAQYELTVISEAEAGDTVIYGDVKWLVADASKDAGKLLIRKNPAEKQQAVYQNSGTAVSWETSNMRKWLNEDFFQKCFSEYEQAAVSKTQVYTQANSVYGTGSSSVTEDSVFLLDEKEAQQYSSILASDNNRKAWWLRTPGKAEDSAVFVSAEGAVMNYGYAADSTEIAVRPAVWINPEQVAFVSAEKRED